MIDLPDHGYSPDNYQRLVSATKLKPKQFCQQFGIPAPTFYQHRRGTRTMSWKQWFALLNEVESYLEQSTPL